MPLGRVVSVLSPRSSEVNVVIPSKSPAEGGDEGGDALGAGAIATIASGRRCQFPCKLRMRDRPAVTS